MFHGCICLFLHYNMKHQLLGLKEEYVGCIIWLSQCRKLALGDGNFYLYKLQTFGKSSFATTPKVLQNVCKHNSFSLNNDTCKTTSDFSCLFEHFYLESWNSSNDPKYFYLFICSFKHRTQK